MANSLSDVQHNVIEALAVLGNLTLPLLEEFLDCSLTQEQVERLTDTHFVSWHQGIFMLNGEFSSKWLEELKEQNRQHYAELHERGLSLLGRHLSAGESDMEPLFIRLLIRLAETYYTFAPEELAPLTQRLANIPIKHPETQQTMCYYTALVHRVENNYDAAIATLGTLLEEAALAPPLRGQALLTRGISYSLKGEYANARKNYVRSLEVWKSIDDLYQQSVTLCNIGIDAYELHLYDEAETYLNQSLAIAERIGSMPRQVIARMELGLIHRNRGSWEQALDCFEFQVEYWRAQQTWTRMANGLNNCGEVQFFLGQFGAAENAFHQALDHISESDHRVDVILNLGMVHLVQDKLPQAEDYLIRAQTLATETGRRDLLPSICFRLGDVMRQQGEQAGALRQIQRGIEQIEDLRNPLQDEDMKIGLLGRWQQIYESMVLLHLENDALAEALNYVERARSRAFLDMVAATQLLDDEAPASLDEPLSTEEIQSTLAPDTAIIEFFITGLPGTSAGIIANLPPENQALRDHLLPPERLLAFVITSDAINVVELPAKIRQIQSQLFNNRDGRLRGVTPLPGKRLGSMRRWQDLGAKLLEPLQPYLIGKRHVNLVPHGLLHYLPLHALAELSTLTQTHGTTCGYAPSASILLKSTKTIANGSDRLSASSQQILSLGVNADDLAHAEAEAKWISRQFDGAHLLGDAATPSAVCAALPNYDIIHFSCHGHFRQRAPMESALQLADGELTAAMLLESVRLKADLVVLSACDTGLNDLHPGDELMGLTRAFLGCGARSLLATLWPVHEIPTRIFMEHFYETWFSGTTKAAAVLAAQQAVAGMKTETLRNQLEQYGLDPSKIEETLSLFSAMLPGDRPFDHPYYWGGFILTGASD